MPSFIPHLLFPIVPIVFGALQIASSAGATPTDVPAPSETGIVAFKESIGPDGVRKFQDRLENLNRDIIKRGILPFPGSTEKLLTGYAYHEFYDWDLYFENIYLSYYGISDYCFSNFKAFMAIQSPDGFIPRMLKRRNRQMFKPFLAQIAVLGSQQKGGDYEWLRAGYYDQLGMYIDRWFGYDHDGNGLPVWDSSDASGMDNQTSRAGEIGEGFCEGVDLACYLHRELCCMAAIARKLGKEEDEMAFRGRAEKLKASINRVFWNDAEGFYYDRNERTGKPIKVQSVAAFIPLWAGVASPGQAKRLIEEHLTNEKKFWLKYPVAGYAATEPDFYQGCREGECNWRGTTWVPTNYMIFHGLLRYGFKEIARDLAWRTYRMAMDENPVTREYYDSDTGKGNGMNPFWGWSALAYVMPLEWETGYNPMSEETKPSPMISTGLGIVWPGHL